MKKCKKCKGEIFNIKVIPCCDDCVHNGAYDDEPGNSGYIYDQKVIDEKGLLRNEVNDGGECEMGSAFGSGCYMFTCSKCGFVDNLPVSEGC